MKKYLTLLLFLSFFINENFSQPIGAAYHKNYSYAETGSQAQNWAVIQDKRGIMYFGTTGGILEFDGASWRSIRVKDDFPVRNLCIDDFGRIYAAGFGDFGYLAPDDKGEMSYFSISSRLDTSVVERPDVWRTICINNEIYFQTRNQVFIFRPYANSDSIFDDSQENLKKIKVINLHNAQRIFNVDNECYAVSDRVYKMQNDSLVELPNSISEDKLYQQSIRFVKKLDDDKLLIATNYELIIFNAKATDNEDAFTVFHTQVDDYLRENSMFCGIKLPNGRFAIGTNVGGVVIIDKNGKLVDIFSTENIMQDNSVWGLFYKDNVLWVTLNSGIDAIEVGTHFRYWDKKNGIASTTLRMTSFNNTLYVGNFGGVSYLNVNDLHNQNVEFETIDNLSSGVWGFASLNNRLFAGSSVGFLEITDNEANFINPYASYALKKSEIDSNYFYSGSNVSLFIFHYNNGSWDEQEIKGLEGFIMSIAETPDGDIWLGTYNNGVFCIDKKDVNNFDFSNPDNYTISHFDTTSGLSSVIANAVYYIDNQVVVAGVDGLLKYNKVEQKFYKTNDFGTYFGDEGHQATFLLFQKNKDICVDGKIILKHKSDNSYAIDSLFFKRMKDNDATSLYQLNDNIVLKGTDKALFFYDLRDSITNIFNYKAHIRKVVVNGDSVICSGTFFKVLNDSVRIAVDSQNISVFPILEYKNNSLMFHYSASFYSASEKIIYSYKLVGYDKKWSAWTNEIKKEYTNLPEGDYSFQVKAENIYGTVSDIASYNFKILPPWYRTWWAFVMYFVIFSLFIWGLLKLNSQRLKKANIRLENIVKQRTAEIQQQNEEIQAQADNLEIVNTALSEQKAEISAKNEQITASIRYAETIQLAVLPFDSRVSKHLNYFVLFKPKDIVSGDFWWYSHINNSSYIAVADCTGHGVPGAFMSMIGTQLLNKIINEDKIFSPAQILTNLNDEIKIALKQKDSNNQDGMDVCLCQIEQEKIVFAGAKRPLYVYQNSTKSLERFKGTRRSIGGLSNDKINFENVEIKYSAGDFIYLASDGYIDQNNPQRKRLGSKLFKEIIISAAEFDLQKQKQIFETELEKWQQGEFQRDDITVLGIKL